MKKSWFYPFIAGIYDFYFSTLLLGAILALGVSIAQIPLPLIIGLSILVFSLLGVMAYYLFFASQTTWLSPGELLVGRMLQNNQKQWSNPYGYNRWALFLMIFFTLIIVGNTWDGLSEGYVYSVMEVVLRVVFVALLSYGLVEMARGRVRAVIYPISYFIFLAFQISQESQSFPGVNRESLQFLGMILIGFALLYLIVATIYGLLKNKHDKVLLKIPEGILAHEAGRNDMPE